LDLAHHSPSIPNIITHDSTLIVDWTRDKNMMSVGTGTNKDNTS
jgi:hypothetical protein